MGFFKKKASLVEEIEELVQLEKNLEVQQKDVGPVQRAFLSFLFLLSVFLSLVLHRYPLYAVGLWMPFVVLLFALPISRKMDKRKLTKVKTQKDEKVKQLMESVKNTSSFISQLKEKDEETHEIADFTSLSPICTLWDKVTHKYMYNDKALICPYCKSHNGLSDNLLINYICPNCKKEIRSSKKED